MSGETQVHDDRDKSENDGTKPECMSRWKHRWVWVWSGGVWTDRMRCSTCGQERLAQETGQ